MYPIQYTPVQVYSTQVHLVMLQLNEDGPGEEPGEDDTLSSFNEWALPAKEFDGLWER